MVSVEANLQRLKEGLLYQPPVPSLYRTEQQKRNLYAGPSGPQSTSVSRRNARERKRVRLVNLGFSTLRERVPPSTTKNKKLSKVETLRAAIDYIRQLQQLLGMPEEDRVPTPDDGAEESSPTSSNPSDYNYVYATTAQVGQDLMDMWFT